MTPEQEEQILERLAQLEAVAHTPVDFSPWLRRIEELERKLDRLNNQNSRLDHGAY